jgi:hypothetical protein
MSNSLEILASATAPASGRFCLAFLSNLTKGGGIRNATLIDTEEPGDLAQSRALLGGKCAARSQHLPD